MKSSVSIKTNFFFSVNLILFLLFPAAVMAQLKTITGTIVEKGNDQPVAFANVALFDSTATILIGGCAGSDEGFFSLRNVETGNYRIRISAIGYHTFMQEISMNGETELNLGQINLAPDNLLIDDVTVVTNRIRATTSNGKTTYFVGQNMVDASNNGTDILKLIPGIGVDMQQNIFFEGSQNLLILVNGRERDRSFLSQLNASKIDKIEILSSPPAGYDATVTGIINVILNKDRDAGLDGHAYAEIPTKKSEVFIFPNYSINYGTGKVNLFTSYNGEMLYFDIIESSRRFVQGSDQANEYYTVQDVRQNYWSHRFHYGSDYFINNRNHLNFYGFVNPWSQQHNGLTSMNINGTEHWKAEKQDKDINTGFFNSIFYKHIFDESKGKEISSDFSKYRFKADNTIEYRNNETGYNQTNRSQPLHGAYNLRIDYAMPFTPRIMMNSGIQMKLHEMKDRLNKDFHYKEKNYAAHLSLNYKSERFETIGGLRFEYSESGNKSGDVKTIYALLPNFTANYRLKEAMNLKFWYRRSITYPRLYQLNPNLVVDDPYRSVSGNPALQPGFRNNLALELSLRAGNNFVSARGFIDHFSNLIQDISEIWDDQILKTTKFNTGTMWQYGLLLTGSLNPLKNTGMNMYMKLAGNNSIPAEDMKTMGVSERSQFIYETAFSAYINFRHGFTASANLQYTSPVNEIQGTTFSDALYSVSLEKQFGRNLKAGISSVLPFAGNFTYRGYEVTSNDFQFHTDGNINLPQIPIFFKLRYQFQSGQRRNRIDRPKETIENQPRRGF